MSKPVFSDLFNVHCRRNRKSYAQVLAFVALPLIALIMVLAIGTKTDIGGIAALLIMLLLLVILIVATTQRLNDIGWSGWLATAVIFLPIGFFLELALLLIPGEMGPNEHGPDPLAPVPPA
jgi:uncharacterized membrane protein YhaH (DUF805 family)